jgi:hypothetical protein
MGALRKVDHVFLSEQPLDKAVEFLSSRQRQGW